MEVKEILVTELTDRKATDIVLTENVSITLQVTMDNEH